MNASERDGHVAAMSLSVNGCILIGRMALVLGERVAETALTYYRANLTKTGNGKEWTVLAAVVLVQHPPAPVDVPETSVESAEEVAANAAQLSVVAMGTGSKCIGAAKVPPTGDVVVDGHAEVMARRSFVRYVRM